VWLPNRIELFAAELCAVARSKERARARDYATALGSADRPRAPSRAPADPRVEEPRGFALRRNYAEGPRLRLALANTRSSVVFAGEVGAWGRAASPTYAGENCENLRMRADSE
jgi:hypothetical protein